MAGPHATVLVVDDEKSVRTILGKMLERWGHTVHLMKDGEEAVAFFREHTDEIDLVILDMTMPRMDGGEALRELRIIRGDIRIVLTSGYGPPDVMKLYPDDSRIGFLQKPLQMSPLSKIVKQMLGS